MCPVRPGPCFSGCALVGPDFHTPPAAVSGNWIDSGDERIGAGPVVSRAWWKVFNDPVLDGLIERAYRENLSLRIAGTRVLQARAQLGIAVGEFYPQTQYASGNLQRNRISESAFIGSGTYTQAEVGANLSWELDFWGRFRRNIESADAAWMGTVADFDNVLVSLTADVASTYILIRTLNKRISIARENAAAQQEILAISLARFRSGLVSELDVAQAETTLENTLAIIPALEIQLRQAKDALSLLIGAPPGDPDTALMDAAGIPVSPPQVVAGIPADLLRRRPDIRSAEYQAAAQCARIGVAKADLYPAFSLAGTFGFLATDVGRSNLGNLFKWGSRTYQVGSSVQWNIFNYGQIRNNVRFQDALFQELLITYQNTVLAAQRDVEDNLVSFLRSQERAGHLARSTAAARRSLDIAVLQYRQGLVNFTAVLTAEQALFSEQDSLAATLGNISTSLVGVFRAIGGGWEVREGQGLIPPEMAKEMGKRTDWGTLLEPSRYLPPADAMPSSRPRLPDR